MTPPTLSCYSLTHTIVLSLAHLSALYTFAHRKLAISPQKPLLTLYLESMDLGVEKRKEIVLPVPKENDPVQILNEIMMHVLALKAGGGDAWAQYGQAQEELASETP